MCGTAQVTIVMRERVRHVTAVTPAEGGRDLQCWRAYVSCAYLVLDETYSTTAGNSAPSRSAYSCAPDARSNDYGGPATARSTSTRELSPNSICRLPTTRELGFYIGYLNLYEPLEGKVFAPQR